MNRRLPFIMNIVIFILTGCIIFTGFSENGRGESGRAKTA